MLELRPPIRRRKRGGAQRRNMKPQIAFAFLASFLFAEVARAQFSATPLTDMGTALYLGAFPGMLYQGSNVSPSDHAADGIGFAAKIRPLDTRGNPASAGKIVVIAIGMSNWTMAMCGGQPCNSGTFVPTISAAPNFNPRVAIVDCAVSGAVTKYWTSDAAQRPYSTGLYTNCRKLLAKLGYTEAQVQAILWKDVNADPTVSLDSTSVCSPASAVDVCRHEYLFGQLARYVRKRYRHLQQMFVHSRIYAGYATIKLNPEPYVYEYGFGNKWAIWAQINQMRGSGIDPTAGDLSYSAAPWIDWGPYFWASGATPRSDGLTWLPADFDGDGTHPSASGIRKVVDMMVPFYLNSPMTPWMRK